MSTGDEIRLLHGELQERLRRLRSASLRDLIYTRHDLLDTFSAIHAKGVSIALRVNYRDRLIPTMSFIWHAHGSATLVDASKEFQAVWQTFHERAKDSFLTRAKGTFCDVRLSSEPSVPQEIADTAVEIGDALFRQSLVSRNVNRDLRAQLVKNLMREIDKGRVSDVSSLATFLIHNLKVRIDVGVRMGSGVVPLNPGRPTGHQFERLLAREDFQNRLTSAVRIGKPLDWVLPDLGLGENVDARLSLQSTKFLILPLHSQADPGLKRAEVFVIRIIRGDGHLSHELVNSINRCIDLFLSRKYRTGQRETLAILTKEIEKALTGPPLSGDRDLQARLKASLDTIGAGVIASTAAYSFAILRYRPEKGDLVEFYVSEHPSAESSSSLRIDPHLKSDRSISLRLWRTWLSAFTFRNAANFGHVYIPNLQSIPREYREKGLTKVESHRGSGSEISIPIRRGEFSVGVVNIEAKEKDAFNSDESFLISIASGIGSLITALHQSSDATWALDNIEFQEFLHELQRMRTLPNGVELFLEDTKEKLQRMSGRKSTPRTPVELSSVLIGVYDFLTEAYRARATAELAFAHEISVQKYYRYELKDEVEVDESIAVGLEIILKNLADNWRRRGDKDFDRLHVKVIGSSEYSARRSLQILASFHQWYTEKAVLDQAFIAPIEKEGRLHLGLYMVGAITRSLRGVLDFTRVPFTPPGTEFQRYQLNISIPLE